MPHHALALVAQIMMVLGFTTGFVGLHNLLWRQLHAGVVSKAQLAGRIGMPLVIVAMAASLMAVGTGGVMSQSALSYQTLAVFMLTFLVLDERTTIGEFGGRAMVLLAALTVYHAGHWLQPAFWLALGFSLVWLAVVWCWQRQIRYHVWRHIVVLWSIAAAFWLLAPAGAFGLHVNWLTRLCAIGYSSVAIAVSGVYLHALHRAAVRSAANAKKARFDALTGVKTYAAFRAEIEEAFSYSRRNQQPLALIAIDVDRFKAVNDRYGHLAGNDILIGVAKVLQKTVGNSGLFSELYRTGGEEFTILCRRADAQAALPLARACWQAVRQGKFQAQGATIACTLSCGVAALAPDDANTDALYRRADANLYQSKTRGRDTITMHGQAVVDMHLAQPTAAYIFGLRRVCDAKLEPVAETVSLSRHDRHDLNWQPVGTPPPLRAQLPFIRQIAPICTRLALYLTVQELQEEATSRLLAGLAADGPQLWVGLRHLPPAAVLQRVAPAYQRAGVRLFATATPLATAAAHLEALLPLLDGLKLSLPDLRATFATDATLRQAVAVWQARCRQAGVAMLFADVEDAADAAYVTDALHGAYLQGDACDRPALPRLL